MNILTFSTLYPSAARPIHGIFVETRLRQLIASRRVESKVVAPVPWFPSGHRWFGEYAMHARTPLQEWRNGIEVVHPRYPLVPKMGMTLAPLLLAQATGPAVESLSQRHPFQLIDAHYFYPDGVAAALLGRRLGKPVVITARGTDLTLIPRYRLPRRMIRWAAGQAAALITVSASLKDELVRLGVAPERITVMRNGVDLELFRPLGREAARAELGMSRPTLLSVGHLIPRKAHDLAVSALTRLPAFDLVIIGNGPEEARLKQLVSTLGVAPRVRFVASMSQRDLGTYYGAADALILASSREGWANVLLEAMACGTPVIASDVGGAAEVVRSPEAGMLIPERTPQALAAAVQALFARYPDRSATRSYAEQFSWEATSRAQCELFERIVSSPQAAGKCDAQVSAHRA